MRRPRIGIMGPGRSGKDEAASWLVDHLGFRYNGSTSVVISREVARREGTTFEEAHARRHERRDEWRALGDEMRQNDPAVLVRQLLPGTDLIVGVRARVEMEAVRAEGMLDVVFWIDRPGIPEDPTQEFGPELCDAVVPNHWGLPEYHARLAALVGLVARNHRNSEIMFDRRADLV
jgi:hypothetical protein